MRMKKIVENRTLKADAYKPRISRGYPGFSLIFRLPEKGDKLSSESILCIILSKSG